MFETLKLKAADRKALFEAMPQDEQDRIRTADRWVSLLALLAWSLPFGILATVMAITAQTMVIMDHSDIAARGIIDSLAYGVMASLGPAFALYVSTVATRRKVKAWHQKNGTPPGISGEAMRGVGVDA